MKPRIKAYNWNWTFGMNTYYQFPDGRVCRAEVGDSGQTWADVYKYNQVPFVGY